MRIPFVVSFPVEIGLVAKAVRKCSKEFPLGPRDKPVRLRLAPLRDGAEKRLEIVRKAGRLRQARGSAGRGTHVRAEGKPLRADDDPARLLASIFERFGDPRRSLEGFDGLPRGHGHGGLHVADAAPRHGDQNG